jgi:hypothetical protein
VVATKDDGSCVTGEGLLDALGGALGTVGDFVEERGAVVAAALGLGHRDRDIAAVDDAVAEGFELGLEAGYAESGGAHVDSAAALAEVERDTDNFDFFCEIW